MPPANLTPDRKQETAMADTEKKAAGTTEPKKATAKAKAAPKAPPKPAPAPEPVAAPVAQTQPEADPSKAIVRKKYSVELLGGGGKYPVQEIEAIDESEAIGIFVIQNGVRDSAAYRRRVTLVDDNG